MVKAFQSMASQGWRKGFWLVVALSFAIGLSSGSYGAISLTVSRPVVEDGEQLSLEIESDSRQEFNRISTIPGLSAFEVVSESSSSRMQVINGSVSSVYSKSLILRAKGPGRYTIGPVQVSIGRKKVRSNKVKVRVSKVSADPNRPKPFFLRAAIEPESSYVNQQVAYVLKFYFLENFFRPRLTIPDFKGFWREGEEVQKDYTERVGEVTYKVKEIRLAMFPQQLGKLTLEPAAFTIEIPAGRGSPRVFDPFMGTPTRRVQLESNPVTLTVRKIAAKGLTTPYVGALQVKSSSLGAKAKVGDSLNLTIEVEGTGNVRDVEIPDLDLKNARIYVDKPEQSFDQDKQGRVTGKRIFSLAIVPEQPGTLVVPAITFTALDPATGKVQRRQIKEQRVEVVAAPTGSLPGGSASSASAGSGPGQQGSQQQQGRSVVKQQVKVVGSDISSAPLARSSTLVPLPLKPRLWFWLTLGLFAVLGFIVMGMALVPDWRQRLQLRKAKRSAYRQALAQLASNKAGGDTSVVRGFLTTRLQRNFAAASGAEMVAAVGESAKVAPQLTERLQQYFDWSERQHYSRSAVHSGQDLAEVRGLLKQLDRALP